VNWTSAVRGVFPLSASNTPVSPWLNDEFVESYASWREESAAVRSAYERWASADARDRALASAAYRAALDREGHAAGAYRECAERINRRAA
jgi:hypothetical protein